MEDRHGAPVSSGKPQSLEIYEHALRSLNCYRGDPVAVIDEALEQDPDFVMGHVLRAQVHVTLWEKSVVPEVESSLARLADLAATSNEREAAHARALKQWVSGDWNGYRQTLDLLLADHPRDLLALQVGHISDFFNGDRDNLRGRVARALPAWTKEDPGYPFLLGMHAFGLEECGDYRQAEERGRQAIELEPEDCWAQHAIAHVMEMEARQAEAITFMESRKAHWAQQDNAFQFHNWWHTALYNLDQGQAGRALEIYDQGVRAERAEFQVMLLDAAALLWRLHLLGHDVGDRWTEVADIYEADGEAGFYAFNDMHAMMAFTATGRTQAAARRLAEVEAAATAEGTNGMMTREVGLPVARGIEAFGREAYAACVEQLLPIRYKAYHFGGSHAQRDVIHRTLLEAAARAGNGSLLTALTNERVSLKPDCPFTRKLSSRATGGLAA